MNYDFDGHLVCGGVFANGAVTGAFAYAFGRMAQAGGPGGEQEPTMLADAGDTTGTASDVVYGGAPPLELGWFGLGKVAGIVARFFGAGRAAVQIGMLREASSKIGNFSIGTVNSAAEANALGEAWVGSGYRVSESGRAWLSVDGAKVYRPPTFKPSWGEHQANFMRIDTATGRALSNAHLTVTK